MQYYPRLRKLRVAHKLKQREIAAILGCSESVYSNYECGARNISVQVLKKLAVIYEVKIDYLIGEMLEY